MHLFTKSSKISKGKGGSQRHTRWRNNKNKRREITPQYQEAITCQQIGQPRRNRQISRNIKLAKTESIRNRQFDQSLAKKLNL